MKLSKSEIGKKAAIAQWENYSPEQKKEKMAKLLLCKKNNWKFDWSKEFEKCVDCGTKEIKHYSKGRCRECHNVWYKDFQTEKRESFTRMTYFDDGQFFGTKGVLAQNESGDRIQCHLCGRWYKHLGVHVEARHRWNTKDYKREFGLNVYSQGLVTEEISQRLSETLKETERKHGTPKIVQEWRDGVHSAHFLKNHSQKRSEQMKIQKSKVMKEMGGWQSKVD